MLIHSLRRLLAHDCLPLFTSDGLNVYFYALTARFGEWLQVGQRGRSMRRWQVAAGLIYGQVKKCYRRRKLVRVTHVMRLGTEDALQGLGFSGRLNTASIERVNLTVRLGIAAASSPYLGHSAAVASPGSSPGMVASLLSFCASSPIAAGEARAAARTRGQPIGATLPATDSCDGSWQNPSTMDGARGDLVPLAAGLRLRATRARCGFLAWICRNVKKTCSHGTERLHVLFSGNNLVLFYPGKP
jgi:hypothetical protein